MKQAITNGQLATLVANILTNPFSGEVDDQVAFEQFCTDIAQVICDYCGGEVVTPASYAPEVGCMDWSKHYRLEMQPNESSPEGGGIWANPQITAKSPVPVVSSTPRVLVVVSGGIADPIYDDGVDVEVFDWDNYKDDPEGTGGVSSHFADLAKLCDIPVEDKSLLT